MKFSIEQQIEEVERELKMRESAYPRWVRSGKLRQSIADYQMDRMRAVLDTLVSLLPIGEPKRQKMEALNEENQNRR